MWGRSRIESPDGSSFAMSSQILPNTRSRLVWKILDKRVWRQQDEMMCRLLQNNQHVRPLWDNQLRDPSSRRAWIALKNETPARSGRRCMLLSLCLPQQWGRGWQRLGYLKEKTLIVIHSASSQVLELHGATCNKWTFDWKARQSTIIIDLNHDNLNGRNYKINILLNNSNRGLRGQQLYLWN